MFILPLHKNKRTRNEKITLALLATTILAFGHGSVTPQAIDTKNLKPLGAERRGKPVYQLYATKPTNR